MRRFFMLLGAALLVAGSGCELEKQLEKLEQSGNETVYTPKYVLSIHEIVKYPKATMLERPVDTYSGETIYVNANSLLHSRNIKKITRIPRKDEPGFYDLVITLDRRGYLQWSSFSYRTRGRKLACILDGLCYRLFVPEKPNADSDDEAKEHEVKMEGPFDEVTAVNLQRYSTKNYDHYNP